LRKIESLLEKYIPNLNELEYRYKQKCEKENITYNESKNYKKFKSILILILFLKNRYFSNRKNESFRKNRS
jgi:hypothetical protein